MHLHLFGSSILINLQMSNLITAVIYFHYNACFRNVSLKLKTGGNANRKCRSFGSAWTFTIVKERAAKLGMVSAGIQLT